VSDPVDSGAATAPGALRYGHGRRAHLMTDDVIYGTRGVLAYDEAADCVQCHGCGGW